MTSTAPTLAPHETRRATRDTAGTYLGGVASGLARHLGLPVLWVRIGFMIGAALGGAGIAFYAGLWMVLPTDERFSDEAPGLASATRTGKRPQEARKLGDIGPTIALGALGIGIVLMFETAFGRGALFWPLVIGIVGVALIWRQADEAQRERWIDSSERINPLRALFGAGGWASYARVFAGGALIFVALGTFALTSGGVGVAREIVIAGLLGVIGIAITLGPWIFRLASDLVDERAERVRSQERADVAAHLHDSVLQTLALIQKNSHDPAVVSRLARSQERDLRAWLFTTPTDSGESIAAALRELSAEIEDAWGVDVETVTVGDTPVPETVAPIVHATREALTNAAKHAGAPKIDVYAEVSPSAVEIFVKDRGVGFDPAAMPEDRHGVRGSIVARMERHGGHAEIRSTAGVGTEVVLKMPLQEERS
ncbi:signal transduction histidine kinase/phage shock protein PspC (stress-responsive transcriptional regulator) [Nocardioides daedukensis]|uniref:Signal transduction histidine kinase/phage shock protein PspC (Stress-responsive transcriptional regulator) n=1 Tax=Nocardioides daedukensis TaxID=634462 RepID=A0A7Y9URU8_9ACTN|nr:ATP-binding protein [Nocardioides daedukensis]NYG60191.1 signal transduction histidine kinase/phage shock protein PspC (stress-responsive transcriptional regulator) [Nocardioides daedukensis]